MSGAIEEFESSGLQPARGEGRNKPPLRRRVAIGTLLVGLAAGCTTTTEEGVRAPKIVGGTVTTRESAPSKQTTTAPTGTLQTEASAVTTEASQAAATVPVPPGLSPAQIEAIDALHLPRNTDQAPAPDVYTHLVRQDGQVSVAEAGLFCGLGKLASRLGRRIEPGITENNIAQLSTPLDTAALAQGRPAMEYPVPACGVTFRVNNVPGTPNAPFLVGDYTADKTAKDVINN